jgi:phosphate-selective porin
MTAAVLCGSLLATAGAVRAQEGSDAATPAESDVAGRLEGMTEQLQALLGDVDKLRRFKFSGYVQARVENAENQSDSVRVTGSPAAATAFNSQRFFIRRARLKLTYDASPLSQAVFYVDGGTDRTIRLLEAYVTLLDPWTPLHQHQLTIGQMNVPFGYEIERSSSVRELPERSRAENVLFSGERDRGLKWVSAWTPRFETVLGVFNGGGVNHPDFPNTDPTKAKDVLGRARWSQGSLDVAGSYYRGREVTPLTGPDVTTDKTRLGLDAQVFYQLAPFGGGTLRGEYYGGTNANPDSVRALTETPASPASGRLPRAGADLDHFATDFSGWYAMWVQNLGEHWQLAARLERFDPDTNVDHDQFERLGLGVNWFFDGFTRVSLAYDVPETDRALPGGGFEDPADNLWTVQVQHKF